MDLVLDNLFIVSPLCSVSSRWNWVRWIPIVLKLPPTHVLHFFPSAEESGAYYSHIGPGSGMNRFGLEVGWQRIGPRVWRCRGRWPQILTSRKAKASVSPFLPILWELLFEEDPLETSAFRPWLVDPPLQFPMNNMILIYHLFNLVDLRLS